MVTAIAMVTVALCGIVVPALLLSNRLKLLETENAKLADYVLAAQKENLLLPEHMAALTTQPRQTGEDAPGAQGRERTQGCADRLLDLVEDLEVTNIRADGCRIFIEFGDLGISDYIPSESPVLLYRGVRVAVPNGRDMVKRFRRIFNSKLTEKIEKEQKIEKEHRKRRVSWG